MVRAGPGIAVPNGVTGRHRPGARPFSPSSATSGPRRRGKRRDGPDPIERDPLRHLTTLALLAPVTAQAALLAVMLVEGRWMFAAMVAPGLIGCLASVVLSMAQRRRQAESDARLASAVEDSGRGVVPSPPNAADMAAMIGALPSTGLEELLGCADDPLPWRTIARRWLAACASADTRAGFAAPIGMGPDGVVALDLIRQGPHALVAGTTGSGKSVLLQSWCLALAAAQPPERLRFVFLDFKGGSAFRPLERLPHAAGSVCDLDLKHATRALRAIEGELVRRERLVARTHAGDISALDDPPPRLLIVVDEFHALHAQLPDYVDRLVRIAALGRSLGMHVIACTQNPLGQVSADMKANMSLNLCLRVRDGLQSSELLGLSCAASISPSVPGGAFCFDGEDIAPLRCAAPRDIDALVRHIRLAARFHGSERARPLFTAPLPRIVPSDSILAAGTPTAQSANAHMGRATDTHPAPPALPFGMADDGVSLRTATMPMGCGNIAVIGAQGRGKSTLLDTLRAVARDVPGLAVRISTRDRDAWRTVDDHTSAPMTRRSAPDGPPTQPHLIWLVDDADPLLDPFADNPMSARLTRAMADPRVTVVIALVTPRHLKVPEHCAMRLVFPTGERPVDLMNGVPSDALAEFDHDALMLPGRGVWLVRGRATPVQCASARADRTKDAGAVKTRRFPRRNS